MSDQHLFASATAVTEDGSNRYRGEIQPGWDVVGNANGGYLMAMAARAGSAAAGGRAPLSVTAHFLSPGRPGPVRFDTTVHKQGRRLSTVGVAVIALTDDEGRETERPLVQLLGAFGDDPGTDSDIERIDVERPDIPDPDYCIAMEGGDGFPPPLMNRVDLRLHPDDAGFGSGRPLFQGWIRLLDDEPVDPFALMLAADVFPPTVFNANLPVAWAPTIELTVHVRGIPEPGWLQCRFVSHYLMGGLVEEDGEVWDSTGRLVAQSRQLALIPRSDG